MRIQIFFVRCTIHSKLLKIFPAKKKIQLSITIYISYNAITGDALSNKTERKVKIELTPQISCSKS